MTESISDVLADALADANAEEVRARHAAEAAQRAATVWKRLSEYHSKRWPAHLASVFYGEVAFFQGLRAAGDHRLPELERLQQEAEEEARAALKRFPADLDRACTGAGIKLDRTSRHPRYTVRNFIVMEVDEGRLSARITPRDGNITTIPTDIPAIVDHLAREDRRLFAREFDSDKFLKSLLTAYQAALREDSRDTGEQVPFRRVVHRMGKNLARFALDEFNVDLARAIKANKTVVDGYRLQLGHTRNTRQGMLLFELEGSGYVGFLAFSKA
jgi:hypothetical protein